MKGQGGGDQYFKSERKPMNNLQDVNFIESELITVNKKKNAPALDYGGYRDSDHFSNLNKVSQLNQYQSV